MIRLAKRMAQLGHCSRRDAEKIILEGRVKVNNEVVNTVVCFVTPEDNIQIDNKQIINKTQSTKLYKFFKPKGCLTTKSDPNARPIVYDYLDSKYKNLIYIGRLDFNSEGLLLFTNNGALSRYLELPSSRLARTYRVKIFGQVTQDVIEKIQKGLVINGFQYAKSVIKNVSYKNHYTWLNITLFEGKNREIRNIFEFFNFNVTRLIRIEFAGIKLGEDIKYGELQEVNLSQLSCFEQIKALA